LVIVRINFLVHLLVPFRVYLGLLFHKYPFDVTEDPPRFCTHDPKEIETWRYVFIPYYKEQWIKCQSLGICLRSSHSSFVGHLQRMSCYSSQTLVRTMYCGHLFPCPGVPRHPHMIPFQGYSALPL
jgi:hypothetical protein